MPPDQPGGLGDQAYVDIVAYLLQANNVAASGGNRAGRAVVTVTDNLGNAVAGASVTGDFTGAISESGLTGTTNGNGQVTFQTSTTLKGKISVTFCVSNVTATLQWTQSGSGCDSN